MGIFDRLSRLAKAEANHLLDSASDQAQSLFSQGTKAQASPHGSSTSDAGPQWPEQVAEDYAALELPLGADRDALKDAYHDLMRRYHPDKHSSEPSKSELANELTVRIRESYERLDAYLAKAESS